ncbi:hypothetical protein QJQ45_029470 [Haematococcus lacustris]|nr:hypothetical protein QJQ45_029470 [Haematococcus lacustris]
MDTAKRLDGLYNVMQSVEAKLGGGEGVEGIYGSITQTGMQRIFESMRHNCGLDSSSVLVDIGAGLGRPLLHALVSPGIRGSFGVELDHVKVAKANAFLSQTLHHLDQRGVARSGSLPKPRIDCTSVEKVASLEPATHAYSFWEGVPQQGKDAFGRLFASARTLKGVAVVQRSVRGEDPAHMMLEHGFGPLLLIANFPVKMSGSGRSFQAYIFSKISSPSLAFLNAVRSPLPAMDVRPSPLSPEPSQGPSAASQASQESLLILPPASPLTCSPASSSYAERAQEAAPAPQLDKVTQGVVSSGQAPKRSRQLQGKRQDAGPAPQPPDQQQLPQQQQLPEQQLLEEKQTEQQQPGAAPLPLEVLSPHPVKQASIVRYSRQRKTAMLDLTTKKKPASANPNPSAASGAGTRVTRSSSRLAAKA